MLDKKNINGRRHIRTNMKARLKMAHHHLGESYVFTGNLSDGGVFVKLVTNEKPVIGDLVTIQVQDLPMEAPVLSAKVVRVDNDGIGLEFIFE